ETFEEILNFIATGGYALKAYDRFRRLVPEAGGMWRIAKPAVAQQHRLNAGVIVEQPLMTVRFRNGRKIGTVEEGFASVLVPGDRFFFAGLSLDVEHVGPGRDLWRAAHEHVDPPRQPRPADARRPQRLVALPGRRQRMARGPV